MTDRADSSAQVEHNVPIQLAAPQASPQGVKAHCGQLASICLCRMLIAP